MSADESMTCSWCATAAPGEGSFRLVDFTARRQVAFCRLEHVIPWIIREGKRQRGTVESLGNEQLDAARDRLGQRCSHCGEPVGQAGRPLLLTRQRAGQSIDDSFCGFEHLRQWAAAGGRWARKPG